MTIMKKPRHGAHQGFLSYAPREDRHPQPASPGHRWRFSELSWFCHIHDPCHLLAGEQKDCDQEVFSHSPGSVSTDYQGIIDVAHAFSSQELQLLAPCLPECCIG